MGAAGAAGAADSGARGEACLRTQFDLGTALLAMGWDEAKLCEGALMSTALASDFPLWRFLWRFMLCSNARR
jgi:hypothetical protein